MSIGIFLAVMAAALLHAVWNALIKQGASKLTGMAIMTLVQGGFGLAIALSRPIPGNEVWPWLIASGVFHSLYKLFLAYAYDQGDLSRVYPIARGAAPMIVLVVSAFVLSDAIENVEYLGIVVLGLGILTMADGAFRSGESRKLVPLALGSAMATAGYTMVDGMGARVSGDSVAYVGWLFALDAAFFTPLVFLIRGRRALAASGRSWLAGSAAAAASYGAYAIAVWAMTEAPIALVAALRETSILFAVLIGWVLFGDKMGRAKGVAALMIVSGVVLTRL
jgi:drug/metabolite transporter (DMT)-like permease